MTDDLLTWPRISANQRLYVCRPVNRDWKGGFKDYYDPKSRGRPRSIWNFSGQDIRPGHLAVTYMQTNPMLIISVDRPCGRPSSDGAYYWEPLLHFRHGLMLERVEEEAGLEISTLDGYFHADKARLVMAAMRKLYREDDGIFGGYSP